MPGKATWPSLRQPLASKLLQNMDVDSALHTHWHTSAVETFSSTFLFGLGIGEHGDQHAIAGGRNTRNKLPVELLLIIFGHVYDDILLRFPWARNRLLQEDFTSTSLFPYAIASVCALWRDAMSLEPNFWRRIIVFIDDPAISLSVLAAQFSWSREHELHVVVSRRNFCNVNCQHESSQIAMIMQVLGSHIHRIRDLRFDVVFSSSLPSFPNGFCGAADSLRVLRLQCKEDNGASNLTEFRSVTGTEHEDFRCPRLHSIVIDGRNYYEACRRDARWTDTIAGITCLTISRFKPRFRESFSPHELFPPILIALRPVVLRIEDLDLVPSHVVLQPLQHGVNFLYFEECHDPQVMREIFHIAGSPTRLSFTRCNLGGATDGIGSFGHVGRLELVDIDQDLVSALRAWNGLHLDLVNCPSFDDAFLDAMATEENGVFTCASRVRELTIQGCPNFTVAALRRLVESKLHLPPPPEFLDHLGLLLTRFGRINLFRDAPPFSPQDAAWFRENVTHFSCPESVDS